ncbi:MAG TPA: alpha/beta hydrolase, partial [Gemmatimonadales bacterium]|nr:alpha/beta hydrolase [Gemmatimonadales bacterium]
AWWYASRAWTPAILGSDGSPLRGSVAALEKVRLGATDQWILARGRDAHNPVLLFLADGPGGSELPLPRHYHAPLEERFVTVAWDQRGAGKSYRAAAPQAHLTVERIVQDCGELLSILADRSGGAPLYLVGRGWGGIIGLLAAQRWPDRVRAFVGVAPQVNFHESDALAYRRTLEAARHARDIPATTALEGIGEPPYAGPGSAVRYHSLARMQQRFGGSTLSRAVDGDAEHLLGRAPEYSVRDRVRLARGRRRTLDALRPHLAAIDLERDVPRVEVPVYFILGRRDLTAPPEIAERYFGALAAPHKELFWFEDAGHAPAIEDAARFNLLAVSRVLRGPRRTPVPSEARG